ISLLETDDKVQLGMTTTVFIIQKKEAKVVKLPLTALFQDEGQPAVWVYSTDTSQVKLQGVAVLEYQYNSVLIQSGLENGQIVVTAGVHKLHSGQQVRLYKRQPQ
ncbi:MAG: efflux RND transporter periplasmic adaptor subunit, partial [gamma proteobacterium symbiont of Bathyaustriella thionipta]|nr:efflux RND transporter periplasmic adaptor subunit [gamma proteobacterium symbiont of Bathyaustriella thionipta]